MFASKVRFHWLSNLVSDTDVPRQLVPWLLSPPVQYWPYRAKRGSGNANADHGCCGCCWGACGHDRSRLTGGIRMPSHITDYPFVRKAQRAFYNWRPARLTKAPSRFTAFTTNTSLIKERERALVAAVPICLGADCFDSRSRL